MTRAEHPNLRMRMGAELLYNVESAHEVIRRHIDEPDEAPRPDYFAAGAILGYALGAPLAEVRDLGRRAVIAFRDILRRRPPLERFQKPIATGTWLDYSIGSSSVGLVYMYWALLLREDELAREIAENTWDAPNMGKTRIYPEYRVAYGLRELILGRHAEAVSELERLPASAKKYFHQQARAIAALARGARSEVTLAIGDLSNATRLAMRHEYLPQKRIFALPGAGLASYALDHGLMTREELPGDISSFPMELVCFRDRQGDGGA